MKGQLGNIMKQAQQMQAKAEEAQREIATMEVCGESGGGLVKVVLTGAHQAKRVSIDDSLLNDDKDMLEDLIAAAINDAAQKVAKESSQKMSAVTGGLNLPPGMKLPF